MEDSRDLAGGFRTDVLARGLCRRRHAEGTAHLSTTQCRDLAALRNNAPITPERNRSELALR